MNKYKYLFAFAILFIGCSARRNIIGIYETNGKDFKQELIIKKNNRFAFTENSFECISKCQGIWSYLTKDTIELKCDSDTTLYAALQSCYISERVRKIVVMTKTTIKLKNTILIKK